MGRGGGRARGEIPEGGMRTSRPSVFLMMRDGGGDEDDEALARGKERGEGKRGGGREERERGVGRGREEGGGRGRRGESAERADGWTGPGS